MNVIHQSSCFDPEKVAAVYLQCLVNGDLIVNETNSKNQTVRTLFADEDKIDPVLVEKARSQRLQAFGSVLLENRNGYVRSPEPVWEKGDFWIMEGVEAPACDTCTDW